MTMISPFEYCTVCGLVYCHVQNFECVVCGGELEPINGLSIPARSSDNETSKEFLDDGFGNSISVVCEKCKQKTMQVVRPGYFKCTSCD